MIHEPVFLAIFESNGAMVQQVKVISCFGAFGSVVEWHEFIFRVHEDGMLTAIMECASRWNADEDDENEESEDEDMDGDDEPSYGLMNGYAWEDEDSGEFDVEFVIGAWRPRDREGAGMTCKGRLSAGGLTGTYRYLKEHGGIANLYEEDDEADAVDEDTEFPLELVARPESFSVERLNASCLPLAPGEFWFHGHALTNTMDLLSSDVTIVLRSNGTVTGEMDESLGLNQLETGTIQGTWEPEQIRFMMTRKWKMYPKCTFVAQPSIVGLRGLWLTALFHPEDFLFESGMFDFKFFGCRGRAWTESLHPYFQPHFRESVRWLLLSSVRTPLDAMKVTLPSCVWPYVLSFTCEGWFNIVTLPRD